MKLKLTPSFYLTDELEDSPRVVHQQTGQDHGPSDIVRWYPSWGWQPCRLSVRRAAALIQLSPDGVDLVSRFCDPVPPVADVHAHIHLRVPMSRKNTYVHAARRKGRPLAAWMIEVCDRAADAEDK